MVSRLRQAWLITTPMPTSVDHTVRPMRGTSDWPRRARWPVTTTSVVSGGCVSTGVRGRELLRAVRGHPHHPALATTIAPVISRLSRLSGSIAFQPSAMSWS